MSARVCSAPSLLDRVTTIPIQNTNPPQSLHGENLPPSSSIIQSTEINLSVRRFNSLQGSSSTISTPNMTSTTTPTIELRHRDVCRNLFGTPSTPLSSSIREEEILKHQSEEYNFNFKTETPLPGRYQWVRVQPMAATTVSTNPPTSSNSPGQYPVSSSPPLSEPSKPKQRRLESNDKIESSEEAPIVLLKCHSPNTTPSLSQSKIYFTPITGKATSTPHPSTSSTIITTISGQRSTSPSVNVGKEVPSLVNVTVRDPLEGESSAQKYLKTDGSNARRKTTQLEIAVFGSLKKRRLTGNRHGKPSQLTTAEKKAAF